MYVQLLFFSSSNAISAVFLAIFGFSNHIYGDQHAFEKTRRGCQLLTTFISDLTANHTKPITDEKELIQRALGLLDDNQT